MDTSGGSEFYSVSSQWVGHAQRYVSTVRVAEINANRRLLKYIFEDKIGYTASSVLLYMNNNNKSSPMKSLGPLQHHGVVLSVVLSRCIVSEHTLQPIW